MRKKIAKLAFQGNWDELLAILRNEPRLVDSASETKGFTPLHQAAWHGANLKVIGEILALGANRGARTINNAQTAQDLALEMHPERKDLHYILFPDKRTIAQLLRKVHANTPDLFGAYDGNQIVFDRLVAFFDSDFCHCADEDIETRIDNVFKSITGLALLSSRPINFELSEHFSFSADINFWRNQLLPVLIELNKRAQSIPIEHDWAVMSDLFEPSPQPWGSRGDLFLWLEMRQALCHVEIPNDAESLSQTISAAFRALTGMKLDRNCQPSVKRLSRGGMSTGMVCGEFWSLKFIPLLQQRAKWLQETWTSPNECTA